MHNFVLELNLESLLSDWFTLGLVGCLVLHMLLTKQKRLVSFCMFLVIVQFINWQLNPWVYSHQHAIYLWYVTWMITDVAILLFVAYRAVVTKIVTKEELAVSAFTTIAIAFHIWRYIERHFTEFEFIKDIQSYAYASVNICILAVLTLPILKQLAFAVGRYLNGLTVFGFRFSISRVQSHNAFSELQGPSKKKRKIL